MKQWHFVWPQIPHDWRNAGRSLTQQLVGQVPRAGSLATTVGTLAAHAKPKCSFMSQLRVPQKHPKAPILVEDATTMTYRQRCLPKSKGINPKESRLQIRGDISVGFYTMNRWKQPPYPGRRCAHLCTDHRKKNHQILTKEVVKLLIKTSGIWKLVSSWHRASIVSVVSLKCSLCRLKVVVLRLLLLPPSAQTYPKITNVGF